MSKDILNSIGGAIYKINEAYRYFVLLYKSR